MPELNPDQFQCANCGGVFEKAWTDEEAQAEYDSNPLQQDPNDDVVLVCDGCYRGMMSYEYVGGWGKPNA